MKKDSPNENELYEDLGKELIKQQVGSQWANLVYKSLGLVSQKISQYFFSYWLQIKIHGDLLVTRVSGLNR